MISREEMVDLADFVLNFFDCKRDYSIDIVKDMDYEELMKQLKEIKPSCKIKCTFEEEHGPEYVKMLQSGEWNLECIIAVMYNTKKPEEAEFCIVVFQEYFSKQPRLKQMLNIIHEARHIVEYPKFTSEKEGGDMDYMLFLEYLERKGLGLIVMYSS